MWEVRKIETWVVIDPTPDAEGYITNPATGEPAQYKSYAAAQFAADDLNQGDYL